MAAYRGVYDSLYLQADCQEPGSTPEPYARQSSMGYLYLFLPVRPIIFSSIGPIFANFVWLVERRLWMKLVSRSRGVSTASCASSFVEERARVAVRRRLVAQPGGLTSGLTSVD